MRINDRVKLIINELTWLDPLSETIQDGIRTVFKQSGSLGQKIANFLNGVWLGHPLHPAITDVPIGAWTATVALDALEVSSGHKSFRQGADIALTVGIVGAVGAASAGLADWQHLNGEPRRFGMAHALLNVASLSLFVSSLYMRKRRQRNLARSFALSGYTISILAAYLGGDLVYRQKIGVNKSPETPITPRFIKVMDEEQLVEGEPHRTEVDGISVLLVRKGDEVFAIADVCSHMGGPLSQGKLCEDNSIICPWHGSRYDLASGKVIDGPSAYSQPSFEARIRDRNIEIRQAEKELG